MRACILITCNNTLWFLSSLIFSGHYEKVYILFPAMALGLDCGCPHDTDYLDVKTII